MAEAAEGGHRAGTDPVVDLHRLPLRVEAGGVHRRLGHRVIALTEDPGSFHFARPQVIAVSPDGLRVGLDAWRPTTSSGS